MTSFNIPEIGDQVTLKTDWTFDLYDEHRNKSLIKRKNICFPKVLYPHKGMVNFTIPHGTILQVDRIFIRKDMSDYSSLTFYVIDSPDIDLRPIGNIPNVITSFSVGKIVRFWAKLSDCNLLQF